VLVPALAALHVHLHHRLHGSSLGYVGIGTAAFASWAGVPGPGEPALIAGAIFAVRGRLDLGELLVVAWLGAMAGGLAGWLAGRHAGHALATAPGPLHRQRLQAMARGERFFARFGVLAVYLAPSWVAGAIGFPGRRFLWANALAAAIWVLLVGGGAYLVGPQVGDIVGDAGLVGLIILGLIAVAGIVRILLHRRPRV
jgi:membrane protein DedA with SNARE-associated domain